MILIIDFVLLLFVLLIWCDVERKWDTIFIGFNPPKYWNQLQCDGMADDVQIQAAMDYLAKRWRGGKINLGCGKFILENNINIQSNKRIMLKGESEIDGK